MKNIIRKITESNFSKFINKYNIDLCSKGIEYNFSLAIYKRREILNKFDETFKNNKISLSKLQ